MRPRRHHLARLLLLATLCERASSLTVMMNGLPGAMGKEIASACLRRQGVALAPFALTGKGFGGEVEVEDGHHFSLLTVSPSETREMCSEA